MNSFPCLNSNCSNFGTTRIIIANDHDKENDFFTCGFGILAKKLVCPPTLGQC